MIRITTVNSNDGDGNNGPSSENTIASRIERVLQVNGSGSASFFQGSRDHRLSSVTGGFDDQGYNDFQGSSNDNNHAQSGGGYKRYTVRYFIPQEAVEELEAIIKTFKDRSEATKKQKKKKEYQQKTKVFEDALRWIRGNSSRKHSHRGSGRCEVLPKLLAAEEAESARQDEATATTETTQQQPQDQETDDIDESTIGASDAIRMHIAYDDGRGDPSETITKANFTRTYIVASQEENLLDDLRMLGTVPILRCANNASVLILENPSKKGQRTDKGKEHLKWKGALQNPAEKALVDAAWEVQKKKNRVQIKGGGGGENFQQHQQQQQQQQRGANTRAKGPNPLSCKRKRGEKASSGEAVSKSKKRRARAQRNKAEASTAEGCEIMD